MENKDVSFTKEILERLNEGVYFVDPDRKITYWNKGAEEISGFSHQQVIGRFCQDNILNHITDNGVSLCRDYCPLAKTLSDGKKREAHIYLHHAEGSRVPVYVRTLPMFDKEGKIIGAIEIFQEGEKKIERDKMRETLQLAYKDHLTGLGNRRHLEKELRQNLEKVQLNTLSFAILYMDIDGFKYINDEYGHVFGDQILKAISRTIDNNIRLNDFAVRWGGDEFVIVLMDIESPKDLQQLANKLKTLIEASTITNTEKQVEIPIHISFGGTLAQKSDNIDSLIRRADTLMYQAKQNKNPQVMIDWP